MAATLLSAVATCVVSLVLGQAALRLSGAKEWSWLAPPVGISIAMLLAAPAIYLPGRCTTVVFLLAFLTVAAMIWCGSAAAHRPPVAGLLAGVPVAFLVLVPFLAVKHAGILGVSLDNDMAPHMMIVESYLSQDIANIAPAGYPLGPHAMVAVIAKGLGMSADHAFAGWSMALPVLTAWTALALVRRASWLAQTVTATVVGMPFLMAAYYGQGAFKEVLQACLVLAAVLLLADYGPSLGRGRWVPLALVLGGIVSVYSVAGMPWPVAFGALWFLVIVVLRIRKRGTEGLAAAALAEIPALSIGVAVFVISVLPQITRIIDFISLRQGTGIAKEDMGNLAGPLPGWEAFGVWNNPDFRLPADPAFSGGMWTAFVLVLVLVGVGWAVRRSRLMLPIAAGASMVIWAVSSYSQSPYVAAKALVIASPLLLALAVLPLLGQMPSGLWSSRRSFFRRDPGRMLPWGFAAILVMVLALRVGLSDVEALRASPVGPTDHAEELRRLRPRLHDQPTLFLGNDDYIGWELAGVPVHAPVIGFQELPIRSQKAWSDGKAHDFDSVNAATLNSFDWIITTRDAAGSAPPAGVRLVQTTPNFVLWRRVGPVEQRSILEEGDMPGAILNCGTPRGRAVFRGDGVAAVRPEPVVAPGVAVGPGGTASVELSLDPGRWQLEASYLSRLSITVTAPGLRTTIPPNLERLGPRWPIGEITVRDDDQATVVTFSVDDPILAPGIAGATLTTITATRVAPERVVPIHRACGRYVDWYRPSTQQPSRRPR